MNQQSKSTSNSLIVGLLDIPTAFCVAIYLYVVHVYEKKFVFMLSVYLFVILPVYFLNVCWKYCKEYVIKICDVGNGNNASAKVVCV